MSEHFMLEKGIYLFLSICNVNFAQRSVLVLNTQCSGCPCGGAVHTQSLR